MQKPENLDFKSAIAAVQATIPESMTELYAEVDALRDQAYEIPVEELVERTNRMIGKVEGAAGAPGVTPKNFPRANATRSAIFALKDKLAGL